MYIITREIRINCLSQRLEDNRKLQQKTTKAVHSTNTITCHLARKNQVGTTWYLRMPIYSTSKSVKIKTSFRHV